METPTQEYLTALALTAMWLVVFLAHFTLIRFFDSDQGNVGDEISRTKLSETTTEQASRSKLCGEVCCEQADLVPWRTVVKNNGKIELIIRK